MVSSGVGCTNSTIISRICLGVRNWPFCPAVASLPNMYSYKSPCISRSAMSCSYRSSNPVMIFCNTCGVGIRNIASLMYRAKAVSFCTSLLESSAISTSSPCSVKSGRRPCFMFLIAGKTRWEITLKISRGSLFLNLLQRMDCPTADWGKIFSIFSPVICSNSSVSSSFSSRERMNMR